MAKLRDSATVILTQADVCRLITPELCGGFGAFAGLEAWGIEATNAPGRFRVKLGPPVADPPPRTIPKVETTPFAAPPEMGEPVGDYSPQAQGGRARAKGLSPARRSEIARTAANARWGHANKEIRQ